jgi:hypothetical protein
MDVVRSSTVRFRSQGKDPYSAFQSYRLTFHSDSFQVRRHIHACRRKEFLASLPRNRRAKYCYECFKWFRDGSEWSQHCEEHLRTLDKGCGPIYLSHQRSLLMSPGFCPFCLGQQTEPSRLWFQWTNERDLLLHIDKHLRDEVTDWPFACPHPLCGNEMQSVRELEEHFEKDHDFGNFLFFKLKPRSPPQTAVTKRSRSPEADTPVVKRRFRKMPSDKWQDLKDGFIHWGPLETLPARPELAANNDAKADNLSRASSLQWEMSWNQFDPKQGSPDYSFASASRTVSPPSRTSTPQCFANLPAVSHHEPLYDTPGTSFAPPWLTFGELPDVLPPGPERASDHPDSTSTVSDLPDMSYNPGLQPPGSPDSLISFSEMLVGLSSPELNHSQEPPSPSESLLSFSEILAMPASSKLEHTGSPATHLHTVIDLTSPPPSPRAYFSTSKSGESIVNVGGESPKLNPPRRLAIPPDSCPECQTKLPGPLPPKLLIRERIERCEVCNRKKVERAQTQWAQRGYPEINWSDLSNRVERYIPWLTECLKRRDVPIFRREYTKVRNKFEYEDFLITNPRSGYYGPRGEDIM